MDTSWKSILEFLKIDFWLVFKNSLFMTVFYILIIPVSRGVSNLNNIQSAQCFSQSVALTGVILLVPITRYELDMSIKEIICTKTWSYLKTVSIRLCSGFIILSGIITVFAMIMKNNNCIFPFWTFVFSTILYAGFMGTMGIIFSQIGSNVIVGYLTALGYWSLCQLQIISENNVFFLFPVVSGDLEMQKLIVLILVVVILIGGIVVSIKKFNH